MNISQNTFETRMAEIQSDAGLQELATWLHSLVTERDRLMREKDKSPAELVRLDILWEQYFRVEKTYSKRLREMLDQ